MKFPEAATLRVLLVEDNEFILEVFGDLLVTHSLDIHLTMARSVQEAREVLQSGVFGLVFLDEQLPDGHGHELLSLLASPPHAQTLVVGFTGSGSFEAHSALLIKRLNGQLNKADIDSGLAFWLKQAGLGQKSRARASLVINDARVRQMAQEELTLEMITMEWLMVEEDVKAIAAQAHRLIGLTGLLRLNNFRQICETIHETSSTNRLEAARRAWSYLQHLARQQTPGSGFVQDDPHGI
jgi:CheY-like chemotaxis protein